MSELLHLVPNLNEMMEEYAEGEEEAIQETQPGVVQEEERFEARTEIEQPTKETRKRKKGAEEVETEQRNERVREFISDKAFVFMEKSLRDRVSLFKEGSKTSSHPSWKCLKKEDGKYLASTRHLALLHWSKSFMLTWWE